MTLIATTCGFPAAVISNDKHTHLQGLLWQGGVEGKRRTVDGPRYGSAGKTSFLRYFIEFQTQRSRFVAVIQNETGEIGLDGKLLDYTVTEIDEGCVCCNLAGSVKRAVKGILDEFSPDAIFPSRLSDLLHGLFHLLRKHVRSPPNEAIGHNSTCLLTTLRVRMVVINREST